MSEIGVPKETFKGRKNILSAEFGSNCEYIGESAFVGCENINSIIVNSNNNKFDSRENCNAIIETETNTLILGCKNTIIPNDVTSIGNNAFESILTLLKTINIPNSVTSIGKNAFKGCTGLTSITIPNNVTSIGDYAFEGCTGLKTVYNLSNLTFSEGSEDYGYVAYYADKVYNVPNGSIEGDFIFGKINNVNTLLYYLGNATELTLPADYKGETYVIGTSVFENNTTITSVTIPNSVTSIGDKAFRSCYGLKSVTIPNSVTSIGNAAFYECGFTKLNIPQNVTSIGTRAFVGCRQIIEITVDQKNLNYRVDDNAIIERNTNTLIFGCQSTNDISVKNIGSYAFEGCSGLKSISIGSNVETIGDSAFYGCSGLESIEIPESVTEIGGHAFYNCKITEVTFNAKNCTSMGNENYPVFKNVDKDGVVSYPVSYVTIGENVENIPPYAFYNCSEITKIAIPHKITSIGEYAFYNCKGLKTVFNFSNLTFSKGLTDYGYVAYYAENVYNVPNGSIEGDFIFNVSNNKNELIGYIGKETDLTLPNTYINNGGYEIKDGLFENSNITSITIGNRVTNIGKSAFKDCTELKSVTIPIISINNYFTIKESTFEGCVNLASFSINNAFASKITEINKNAFKGCENLTSIYTDELTNIVSIGESAFDGCKGLVDLYLPDNLETIGDYAFRNCLAYKKCTKNGIDDGNGDFNPPDDIIPINENNIEPAALTPTVLSGFVMPNSVNSIGVGCFEGSGLEKLHITEDCELKTISKSAFENCKQLKSISISNSKITIINSNAFCGCENLGENTFTSLKLPNNIVSIKDNVFEGCENISSVTLPKSLKYLGNKTLPETIIYVNNELTTPPTFTSTIDDSTTEDINSSPFIGNPTIYIYHTLVNTYINNDYWQKYTDFFKTDYGKINDYIKSITINKHDSDNNCYFTITTNQIPEKWNGAKIYYTAYNPNNTSETDNDYFVIDIRETEYTRGTIFKIPTSSGSGPTHTMYAYKLKITNTTNNVPYSSDEIDITQGLIS